MEVLVYGIKTLIRVTDSLVNGINTPVNILTDSVKVPSEFLIQGIRTLNSVVDRLVNDIKTPTEIMIGAVQTSSEFGKTLIDGVAMLIEIVYF